MAEQQQRPSLDKKNNAMPATDSHPYVLFPLVTVCAIALSALIAFGNPTFWMTDNQAAEIDAVGAVDEPVEKHAATTEADLLEQLDEGATVVAEYRSTSQSDDSGRAQNISLAASALNGCIIAPGETFSFNDLIGDTGTDTRYQVAPVVADSDVLYERGGGICQVSTALYIAALESDMEVVERHAHTVVTDYAPIGLDATIDYGTLDLKLKNTSDHPIGVYAQAVGQAVTVKILGNPLAEGVSIDATSKIISQSGEEKDENKTGEEGTYVVESHRVYYQDGNKSSDEYLYKNTYADSSIAEPKLSNGGTDPTK